MTSISELRGLGETPSMEQILDTLELLEKRDIEVADLPMKKIQDKLETDWFPEGKVLLEKKSITADLIAPQDSWIVIGSGVGIAPAFTAPWVNAQAPLTAAFFKDTLGFVHFRGRIGVGGSGTQAFVLPVGYRPGQTGPGDTYPAAAFNGATAIPAFIYITPAGLVFPYYNGAIGDVSLSGILFLAEA